jgi:thiol-disulfide isomerase/thioredoxin
MVVSNGSKAIARTIIAGALVAICALGYLALRPEPLSAGQPLPQIAFRDAGNVVRSTDPRSKGALVIFFHPLCEHCAYELAMLDSAAGKFEKRKVYMLTTDDSLFTRGIARRWPHLASIPSVTWGIVAKNDFTAKFGTLVTPTAFLFDSSGKFVRRIKGETPPGNLVL